MAGTAGQRSAAQAADGANSTATDRRSGRSDPTRRRADGGRDREGERAEDGQWEGIKREPAGGLKRGGRRAAGSGPAEWTATGS
jgi:hypothetical protein